MEHIAIDQIVVNEDSIVDGVGDNEVDRIKVITKTAKSKSQDKNKGKNSTKTSAQSFELGFLTPRVR